MNKIRHTKKQENMAQHRKKQQSKDTVFEETQTLGLTGQRHHFFFKIVFFFDVDHF